MARLSTGETYGNVDRSTPQQLLGGLAVASSAGALAQQDINAPGLQPQAAPVNTYQQTGSPTLGGPVKFFAPPDLPAPQQDLANLAKSLGGFSTTLQQFSENIVGYQKVREAEFEKEAAAFVQQAETTGGPLKGLQNLQRTLEKKAAEGDPVAKRLLLDLQSANPARKRHREDAIAETSLINAAAALPQLLNETQQFTGPDGKPVDRNSVSQNDPVFLTWLDQQLHPDGALSPQAYARRQGLLIQARNQAIMQQGKDYNDNQSRLTTGAVSVNLDGIATNFAAFAAKKIDNTNDKTIDIKQQTYKDLQKLLDQIPMFGLNSDAAAKLRDSIPEQYANALIAAADKYKLTIGNFDAALAPVMALMTGPIDQRKTADGKDNENLRLVNTLGGSQFVNSLIGKMQTSIISRRSQGDQLAQVKARTLADTWVDGALPDPQNATPVQIKDTFAQLLVKAETTIADPYEKMRVIAQLKERQQTLVTVYTKDQQDRRENWFFSQLEITRGNDLIRRALLNQLAADIAAGRVSESTGRTLQTSLVSQGDKIAKDYSAEINERWKVLKKKQMDEAISPGSYGGQTVIQHESDTWSMGEPKFKLGADAVVREALKNGKDPSEALTKWQASKNFGYRPRQAPENSQPIYGSSGDLINKNTNWTNRSFIDARKRNELRGQWRVRPLFPVTELDKEVDYISRTGQASPNMRTILKTVTGGGTTISDFIIRQYQLNKAPLDPGFINVIKSFDAIRISQAAPRPAPGLSFNPAIATLQGIGNQAMNALVPAASAAEFPGTMAMANGGLRMPPVGLLGAITRLRGAASFRGTSQVKYKERGDYQSHPQENFFFDFNPGLVPKAIARAKALSEADINALTFLAIGEAGPTKAGKFEVAANLINRSAAKKNKPIADIAKEPGQYESVFNYRRDQIISAAEGRRIWGARYDQVRKQLIAGK